MEVLDLGRREYRETWDIQKELVEKRVRGEIADTLILVEHEPVYTVGRAWHGGKGNPWLGGAAGAAPGGAPESMSVPGLGRVPVVEIERGGKLTYHGPGQLVGYPIVGIPGHDLRGFLRGIEEGLIETVRRVTGLQAASAPRDLPLEEGQLYTGVWLGNRKVASIGIAVKHWVSYHGFALNVSTDLRYFQAVSPCGFSGDVMTTLEREAGVKGQANQLFTEVKEAAVTVLREWLG